MDVGLLKGYLLFYQSRQFPLIYYSVEFYSLVLLATADDDFGLFSKSNVVIYVYRFQYTLYLAVKPFMRLFRELYFETRNSASLNYHVRSFK